MTHPLHQMQEIDVTSSIDHSVEKNLFWWPSKNQKAPLLVGLHTWSFERSNQVHDMLPLCQKRDWGLLLPEFRGPNLDSNPRVFQACASRLARQDVFDALNKVLRDYPVDEKQIFLLGGSGGGHMALMLASHSPQTWRAVSSWVPITDLATWYSENPNYRPHISACCGGNPGQSSEIDREYRERSPMTHVEKLRDAYLSVHHGRHDPSVPFTHTLRLIQALEKLSPKNFYSEIFDGGHELRYDNAFQWFDTLLASDKKQQELTA